MKQGFLILYHRDAKSSWSKKLHRLGAADAVSLNPVEIRNKLLAASQPFCIFLSGTEIFSQDDWMILQREIRKHPEAKLLYCDYGKEFLPDYSPDLLLVKPYMGSFVVFQTKQVCECLEKIAQDDRLIASMQELRHLLCMTVSKAVLAEDIVHVPVSICPKETFRGEVLPPILYPVEENIKVRIIVPSKDHPDFLIRFIASLEANTDRTLYELTVVDNGSNALHREKIQSLLQEHGAAYSYNVQEFNFSAMCNLGAKGTTEEVLLFLNDDIEMTQQGWLEILLGQCLQSHTGAVGARLCYPSGELQHTGICMLGQNPSHMLMGLTVEQAREKTERLDVNYNYLAVTAACLMIRRDVFEKLGGFDEELSVAFNDVDLCMRAYEQGYYNIVREDVTLVHYESASRGKDLMSSEKMERLGRERAYLWSKHPLLARKGDPFYNRRFSESKSDYSPETFPYPADFSKCVGKLEQYTYLESQLTAYIDRQWKTNHGDLVEGWCFYKNGFWTRQVKLFIVAQKEDGEIVLYATVPRVREDIADKLSLSNHLVGFASRIPAEYKAVGVFLKLPGPVKNKLVWR